MNSLEFRGRTQTAVVTNILGARRGAIPGVLLYPRESRQERSELVRRPHDACDVRRNPSRLLAGFLGRGAQAINLEEMQDGKPHQPVIVTTVLDFTHASTR